ncbi:hypothetical protein Q5O14_07790 [Eubacteriaceae bacterium ES2]|nr:hypothetical protein Q5O14_07790 [Eubacteriaceae bacterium ES2]
MNILSKHEIYILDKRQLQGIEKQIKYWQKFSDLPVKDLQPLFAVKELHSKDKKLRKEVRKEFIRVVEKHNRHNARVRLSNLKQKHAKIKYETEWQYRRFSILDMIIVKTIMLNPNSRINSPSFLCVLAGENAVAGIKKGMGI